MVLAEHHRVAKISTGTRGKQNSPQALVQGCGELLVPPLCHEMYSKKRKTVRTNHAFSFGNQRIIFDEHQLSSEKSVSSEFGDEGMEMEKTGKTLLEEWNVIWFWHMKRADILTLEEFKKRISQIVDESVESLKKKLKKSKKQKDRMYV